MAFGIEMLSTDLAQECFQRILSVALVNGRSFKPFRSGLPHHWINDYTHSSFAYRRVQVALTGSL